MPVTSATCSTAPPVHTTLPRVMMSFTVQTDGAQCGLRLQIAGKITYRHTDGNGTVVAVVRNFATPSLCDALVSLCEEHGFGRKEQDYAQSTVDLEVDAVPRVRDWLLQCGLMPALTRCMLASHGHPPIAFDDVFVVKYDAGADGQRDLLRHVDGGDVSFMLALSPRNAYDAGGTDFDVLEEPLHLEQGDLTLFHADLYHAGIPISRGVRYLLVGFCFVREEAARVPGNLDVNLRTISEG